MNEAERVAARQFANLVRREGLKLGVEAARNRRPPQFLPVRCHIENRQWELGFNRFRHTPRPIRRHHSEGARA